jgi:hypothetical protein
MHGTNVKKKMSTERQIFAADDPRFEGLRQYLNRDG